jgi:hypothetical protein
MFAIPAVSTIIKSVLGTVLVVPTVIVAKGIGGVVGMGLGVVGAFTLADYGYNYVVARVETYKAKKNGTSPVIEKLDTTLSVQQIMAMMDFLRIQKEAADASAALDALNKKEAC